MSWFLQAYDRITDSKYPLIMLAAIGLIIRLILSPTLTFNIDVGYWTDVIGVFENGFGLYGTTGYYYTPIWGYCLGFVSSMMHLFGLTDYGTYVADLAQYVSDDFKVHPFVTSTTFNTILKIPLILVDLATAILLYCFVKKYTDDEKKAILAFSLWFFSPLIITQSSIHGMFDNISAMLILGTVMLLLERKYFVAGFIYSAALLTKFFPLFFIFFLVTMVLKREGIGINGIRKLSIAIAGTIVGFVIIYLPNIINGDIWMSLYFIAYRIGLTKETLATIGPVESAVIITALLLFIFVFLFVIYRFGPLFIGKMEKMDEKERNYKVAKILLTISLVLIALLGIYILVDAIVNPKGLESVGLKGVILFCIFSVFLEIYLAFRMLMEKDLDDRKIMTYLFLTALSVILWPCAPSYILVELPFVIIYCTIIDGKYIRPFIILSLMVTLQEITAFLASPTSLILQLTGNVDPIIPIYEFLTRPVLLGVDGTILLGFTAITGWLSIIYLSYKWYSEYHRGGGS